MLETNETELQFRLFETYYQRKLIWNAFSMVASVLLFLVTIKNLFLYIVLTQLLFSLAFYPSRKLISTELKNSELLFA